MTSTDVETNPREKIGGNNPPLPALISEAAEKEDFSKIVTEWLNERYGSAPTLVQALLDECSALMRHPETGELIEITDDATKGKVASLIKRIRDEAKKLDGLHDKEKVAYQRGGQAIDQYFFGLIDKLSRRDKKNKKGAADFLGDMLTAYDVKLYNEEMARRRAEAERLQREADEKQRAEEAARAAAEAARLAAERARNPEKIEEKTQVAEQKTAEATTASVEAAVATEQARGAHIDTLAKPADIMRQRVDDGTLTTMATEPFAEVVDRTKLDYAALAPYFTLADVEKAVRAWAKNTGYTQQMAGATVGRRPKSVVR